MRKGVSGGVVVLIAIIMLAAGLGIGYEVFRSTGGTAAPKNLIVGTNVPFPPFEDFNTTTGDFEGFDIDLANLISTQLNRTIVIRQFASFTALLGAVGQGGVDMAVSAITMSGSSGTDRNQSMSFSDPYFSADQGALVKSTTTLNCANNVCNANSFAGLNVGVQQGTSSLDWINANKLPSTTVTVFQTVDAEVAALQGGSIDAVIIDIYPAQALARPPASGLAVAGKILTGELYGIPVQKGDPQHLLPTINAVLSRIRSDGTYDQLVRKWFG